MKQLIVPLLRALRRTDAEAALQLAIAHQKKKARTLIAGDFAVLFNLSADLWRIAQKLPPPQLFPPCDSYSIELSPSAGGLPTRPSDSRSMRRTRNVSASAETEPPSSAPKPVTAGKFSSSATVSG